MKIFFDNWNPNSSSGPNSFGKKLFDNLSVDESVYWAGEYLGTPDIQLSFIQAQVLTGSPVIQRLDGIYFNTDQDFKSLNEAINKTYDISKSVIFQSDFNKKLVEEWFGKHESSYVIRNGTNTDVINSIQILENNLLDEFENIWACASSWRPHKRLDENIRYFLEFSGKNDCLVVAGENPDSAIANPRIFYAGHLDWTQLISLFKTSKYFIHLAWLDHCPNVVVDARACGCNIICASSGGTSEISGVDSKIIIEDQWDLSPINLYDPPKLDFSNYKMCEIDSDIDIRSVSNMYLDVFKEALL